MQRFFSDLVFYPYDYAIHVFSCINLHISIIFHNLALHNIMSTMNIMSNEIELIELANNINPLRLSSHNGSNIY